MYAKDSRLWLERVVLLSALFMSTASAVAAQTPQADAGNLRRTLIPDAIVWITDAGGREERMRVVAASDDTVTARVGTETRHLRITDIVRIRARRADSVLNGALIGAGAAVASGLFLCTRTEPWENCRDDVGPILRIAAVGAGIGIGVDALIRGRRTVYEAPRAAARLSVAPVVARRAAGLHVALSF